MKEIIQECPQLKIAIGHFGMVTTPHWQELLKERKLEFYQENDVLWLDMKRMGITVERKINGQNHVLKSNDFRYCLPIPLEEIAVNENIEQTPGWENVIF